MNRFWFNLVGKKLVNNIIRGRRFQGASDKEILCEIESGKWLPFDKMRVDYAKTFLKLK